MKELLKYPGYEFSVRIYEYFLLLLFPPFFGMETRSEGGEERALGEGDGKCGQGSLREEVTSCWTFFFLAVLHGFQGLSSPTGD